MGQGPGVKGQGGMAFKLKEVRDKNNSKPQDLDFSTFTLYLIFTLTDGSKRKSCCSYDSSAFTKAKINVKTMKVALRKSDSVGLYLHITQLMLCPAFAGERSSL